MTGLPALLALWVFGQTTGLPGLGSPRGPVSVRAELASRVGGDKGVIRYEGNAVLETDGLQLRADSLTYDEATQHVEARGRVMLVAGQFVAVGDALALDIPDERVTVTEGVVHQKRGVSPEALRAARTPAELLALGQTTMSVRAARIQRLAPGRFKVEDVSLTPCDCDPRNPTWRIRAAEAELVAGESATLRGWQVLLGDVPVLLPGLPLPWAQIPLTNRRSGLLFPVPTFTGNSGFGLEVPIYWAPHPSFDVTFNPGYFFGLSEEEEATQPFGIKGPRLATEFRYFPDPALEGRLTLGLTYDLRALRDPFDERRAQPDPRRPEEGARRGLRGALSLEHRHDLAPSVGLRANLNLVSDGFYLRDLVRDVVQREQGYTRSTAFLSQRGEDHYVGLDGIFRQDLRNFRFFQPDLTLNPADGTWVPAHGPATHHRLPGLTLALLERPVAGPVFGSLDVDFARSAPLTGPGWDDVALADKLEASPRERRLRLDVRPTLQASLPLGDALRWSPSASWRQTVAYGEVSGSTASRGYPLLDLALESQLARRFGAAGKAGVRHVLTPRARVRWVPGVLGDVTLALPRELREREQVLALPRLPYDARDVPFSVAGTVDAQPRRLLQAVVELGQRFAAVGPGARAGDGLRVDVGQGVDLLPQASGAEAGERRAQLADTYGRLEGRLGAFAADAAARYSPLERRLTQLNAGARWDFSARAGVSMRYDDFLNTGSDRLRRGLDALVGQPRSAVDPARVVRFQQLTAAGSWRTPLRGLDLRGAVVLQRAVEGGKPLQAVTPLGWTEVGAAYAPACDCWRLEGRVNLLRESRDLGGGLAEPFYRPGFGLLLTIANFGTFGI